MAYELEWSERAIGEYENLLLYLRSEWGRDIATRVSTEINLKIIHIKNSPEHYPIFKKAKKVRRCVASPQTSIFFRVDGELIEIMAVFDNRQHPRKRKL